MTAYVTPAEALCLHASGWFELSPGRWITKRPIQDSTRSAPARTPSAALEAWCASRKMRLPTGAEYEALHQAALFVAPVTLPTPEVLAADAAKPVPDGPGPRPWQLAPDYRDSPGMAAYRAARMRTREWCDLHDAEVERRLLAARYDGTQPVANDGKHWEAGGKLVGWWLHPAPRTEKIQNETSAHVAERGVYTDYASTAHAAFDGACPVHPDDVPGASPALPAVPTAVMPAGATIDFIQARGFTRAGRAKVDLVVLHSTENPVANGTARNVARWFAGPQAPQASAHFIVGPDEAVQCVREEDVAWAAPGANAQGVQVEQVGQVGRLPRTDWLGDGRPVLERSARLVAATCRRWGIPAERVDPAGLLAGQRGITTHASVSAAFKRSDHQDPGLAGDQLWPWDEYLRLVRAA